MLNKILKLFFCSVISSTLLLSCNRSIENLSADISEIDTILINLNDNSYEYRDEIFSNINLVKLETNENNMIGNVDQLFCVDSTIIVVDKNISKAVYIFDRNGKFVSRVSSLGRGSHEYLKLTHVFISNGAVAIHDMIKKEINYFDLSGNYLKTVHLDFQFNEVESLDDGSLVCNINQGKYEEYPDLDDYSFVILDMNYRPRYSFGEDNSNSNMTFTRNRNLYPTNGHIFCSVNFSNIIYELLGNEAKAKYRLISTPDELRDVSFKDTKEAMDYISHNPFFFGFFAELNDYSLLSIGVPQLGGFQYYVYNHHNKETIRIPEESLNPILSLFHNPFFYGEGNSVVVAVNSSNIISLRKQMNAQGLRDELIDAVSNDLELDSNPVLIFFEL